VTIPGPLREYAGLDRDVAVIGNGNHVEIWDQQAWEQYVATNEDTYADTEEGV
jgi:MraZ protein